MVLKIRYSRNQCSRISCWHCNFLFHYSRRDRTEQNIKADVLRQMRRVRRETAIRVLITGMETGVPTSRYHRCEYALPGNAVRKADSSHNQRVIRISGACFCWRNKDTSAPPLVGGANEQAELSYLDSPQLSLIKIQLHQQRS